MNNTVLVTCLYNVTYMQPIGGRGYPIATYFPSIVNIVNIGLPIIFYTHVDDVEKLDEFLRGNSFAVTPVYEIKTHDLTTYRHYSKILDKKVKFVNPDYRYYHRCEVLCHTKLHFVEQSYNNQWGKTNVIWIDAGITECSKVPLYYGGTELGDSGIVEKYSYTKYPINSNCIFTPKLGIALDNLVNTEKWFFTELQSPYDGYSNPWHQILIPHISKYFNKDLDVNCKWVVGTIWGGNREHFNNIYNIYNVLVDKLIDVELFPKTEEMYLSVINYGLEYKVFTFDTWYIDVPGEAEYVEGYWLGESSKKQKSFYKTFHDMLKYS